MPAIAPSEPPSFVQALHLEQLPTAGERYMSTFPALSYDYAPGKPLSVNRSYGGHAFAQAIWAASLGIRESGYANRPFIYEVKTLSITRSFALREVIARQPTTPSDECPFPKADGDKELGPVAFALTCSFKQRESGPAYWLKFNADMYGDLLHENPSSYPQDVYFKGPNGVGSIRLADFPSIDIRTPDLQEHSDRNPGTSHRRLHVYRASEPLDLDPNLVAALHAYVSDRAGLSVLLHAFGATDLGISGSLSHKILFHVSPEEMAVNNRTWFTQEMSSSRGGEGRGAIDSRIWSPSGELVATTIQDALFRQPKAKLA